MLDRSKILDHESLAILLSTRPLSELNRPNIHAIIYQLMSINP